MSYSSDSGSADYTTSASATVYEVNTPDYVIDQPVYIESDRLVPSYHNTVIYTDSGPRTYVESDDSCCLVALCIALCCCCCSD